MKPIKIAFIGVNENSHYKQVLTRIRQLTDLFEVAGIAFPENEKERLPQNCANFADLPELTVDEKYIADDNVRDGKRAYAARAQSTNSALEPLRLKAHKGSLTAHLGQG